MSKLTFSSYLSKITNNHDLNKKIDNFQLFIAAVAALLPAAANPASAPVAAALSITAVIKWLSSKDKLIDFGQSLLTFFSKQKPKDYSDRVEKMESAYATVCLTAFFDELNARLPDSIIKQLSITNNEAQWMFNPAKALSSPGGRKTEVVPMPDLMHDALNETSELAELYTAMKDRLVFLVAGLSFYEKGSEQDIRTFETVCEKLPSGAIWRFKSYYLKLCASFNEFFIYTQIHQARDLVRKLSGYQKEMLSLAMGIEKEFNDLSHVIQDLPKSIKKQEALECAQALAKLYSDVISQPVFGTKDNQDILNNSLPLYPSIREMFIPQAYRLLEYTGNERLDHQSVWQALGDPRKDLLPFFAKYLMALDSSRNVLLILGEPGAGKSLLTKILCGELNNEGSMFLRIPMREHNMEDSIEHIVVERLNKDCDPSSPIPTFKWFQEEFPENPITLVFDGFDEVLQATGGLYSRLITKIHEFQEECFGRGRPVRVLVTSRDTLIHKADIPEGTQVMRLEEFDSDQIDKWVSIWNKKNHEILKKHSLTDLSLPKENEDVMKLASQPLLLTMLAVYDADFDTCKNALKTQENLNRTQLYNELLKRFIWRELSKGPRGTEIGFDQLSDTDKQKQIREEMLKLGLVALGMFVRERLFLTRKELESDLISLQIKGLAPTDQIRTVSLDSASALLGSFFFIHASKYESDSKADQNGAFEFMHKTFYEFLLADIVLQAVFATTEKLFYLKSTPKRGKEYYSAALDDPEHDSFDLVYYAVLSGNCLCREPEAIRMMAEWKTEKLAQYAGENEIGPDATSFFQIAEDILDHHLSFVINRGILDFPNRNYLDQFGIIQKGRRNTDRDCEKTSPQRSAIYLLNLLTMLVQTQNELKLSTGSWEWLSQYIRLHIPFSSKKIDEETYEDITDEVFKDIADAAFKVITDKREWQVSPYDDIVLQFTSIFSLKKQGAEMLICRNDVFTDWEQKDLLDAKMSMSRFMLDDVALNMYTLHSHQVTQEDRLDLLSVLSKQGIELTIESAIENMNKRILQLKNGESSDSSSKEPLLTSMLSLNELSSAEACLQYADASLVLEWLDCLSRYFDTVGIYQPGMLLNILDNGVNSLIRHAYTLVSRFADYPSLLLILCKIISNYRQFDIRSLLTDVSKMIAAYLSHVTTADPDVCIELIKILNFAMDKPILTHSQFANLSEAILNGDSLQAIITYLNTCASLITPIEYSDTLDLIQERWNQLFLKSPDRFPALLTIYLYAGRVNDVKMWLRNQLQNDKTHLDIVCSDNYLTIAQTVDESDLFLQTFIESRVERNSAGLDSASANTIVYLFDNKEKSEYIGWLRRFVGNFFERANFLFRAYPTEATMVLCSISKRSEFLNYFTYQFIWRFVFQSIKKIFAQSTETSINALCCYYQMDRSLRRVRPEEKPMELQLESNAVQLCFQAVLAKHDHAHVEDLKTLLKNIDKAVFRSLKSYFYENIVFLRCYDVELARIVEDMLGQP